MFDRRSRAVQLLNGLTPSSTLSSTTLDTWLFNITVADRTLAVVAITNAGGDADASQLVQVATPPRPPVTTSRPSRTTHRPGASSKTTNQPHLWRRFGASEAAA
jgi:hypothetical protein